ncbi:MAG: dihydroorotase [Alphaproteobacteria bacterium]|nr:dihydroorotase [Alphaproteobacteria bacterium]
MIEAYDLVIRGGRLLVDGRLVEADVAALDGKIAAIGEVPRRYAEQGIDAKGLTVLPGCIDTQVHFREPGLEHKDDLESGTRAAVLGGITAVFEMPNTKPTTADAAALEDKLRRARGRTWCDHAFYAGATADNAEKLGELERLPGCCGVKIFMGASTGDLLVPDDATLARVLASGRRRVAVHAEDEFRMRERRHIAEQGGHPRFHPEWRDAESARLATERILRLARAAKRPVHVLHVTTADEVPMLRAAKDIASMEVTPQHLTLEAPDCYERIGTLAQMNPPIREARHRAGLWQAVADGTADIIGSDHAPHTREEKAKPYPQTPSGMPGVQTLLPVMLDHVAAGRLSLARLVEMVTANPVRLFGLKHKGRIAQGMDADFTLVDLAAKRTLRHADMATKSGWTPFDGMTVTGFPVMTVVRGQVVMREGELIGPPIGRPLEFDLG